MEGERPLECGQCKKPIRVIYKEIVDGAIAVTNMCSDCPVLEQKLHGQSIALESAAGLKGREGELCCGTCGIALDSVRTGNLLGCSECYSVFSDVLVEQLISSGKIAGRIKTVPTGKKGTPLHVGKMPKEMNEYSPSSNLMALTEALNEAIKKENYEQAAWLRDQIKALMEKNSDGGKSQAS